MGNLDISTIKLLLGWLYIPPAVLVLCYTAKHSSRVKGNVCAILSLLILSPVVIVLVGAISLLDIVDRLEVKT